MNKIKKICKDINYEKLSKKLKVEVQNSPLINIESAFMTTKNIWWDRSDENNIFDLVKKIKHNNPQARVCVEVGELSDDQKKYFI